jgi:ATP-dependent DNA helicase RecG
MRENGSPPPEFRFDEDHSYFATVLPVHPAAVATVTDLRGDPTAQVTAQVAALVEQVEGELTRSELQDAVGLAHREHFRKAYLLPALQAGLLEMTQPEKPNSRTQRYRLTAAGKQLRLLREKK